MGTGGEERHGDENFSPIVSRESEMPDKTALENPTIPFRFHLGSETNETVTGRPRPRPGLRSLTLRARRASRVARSISLKIIGASAPPGRSESEERRTAVR